MFADMNQEMVAALVGEFEEKILALGV